MSNIVHKNHITNIRLREIVQEELIRKHLLEEGIWDDVNDGIKKCLIMFLNSFNLLPLNWQT